MIIDRKHFDINNKCAIEKLIIKPPIRLDAVFQDEACFTYLKEGELSLSSPTDNLSLQIEESVLLRCGNYFTNAIQKHSTKICEVYAIHLYPDILKQLYKNEFPNFIKSDAHKPYIKKIEKQSVITNFIQSLDFYFENPNLVTEDLLKLKIKELILLLLHTDKAENIITLFSHLFNPRQANIFETVQAHLYSAISVADLAKLTGRSLSAFKRDFETQFNDTPANFIKEKKLEKALDLLQSTELSVSEICYEVGFQDTSHFTKSFKQKYNHSPSEYRKK
ncbi:AraC family transcriptional regulator [Chryseobacterium soli]|uniref:AraC family transcriptional regulator n=1 Tax=Chryseobacterium soli TaxID=445961 RepID=A0A086A1D5_9FLAO|nr:helix-turn-helix domain-containing protein [Chryseobacterium soli]KFF10499.1 AraC family transcriptional regulator [Chryseobacterium soli]